MSSERPTGPCGDDDDVGISSPPNVRQPVRRNPDFHPIFQLVPANGSFRRRCQFTGTSCGHAEVLLLGCAMFEETTEDCVERLVIEYAQSVPASRPLDVRLSLQNDLAIESLSLVSLALRLGTEFGVDVVDAGLELGELKTVEDLLKIARTLKVQSTKA